MCARAEGPVGLEMDDCCLMIVEHDDDFIYVEGLDSDAWRLGDKSFSCLIRNYFNDILEASPENSCAQFQDLTATQSQKDRCKFKRHLYKDTNPGSGLSVSFSVQVESKTYHMYCTKDKSIQFREGGPLKSIPGNTSDIIFYQQAFSVGKSDIFKFRSPLFNGCYLACESGSNRLYLKEAADQVDEACQLTVENLP
ncbi:interleukin-18-like isoform X2 [Lissotriton helveticus]